MNQIEVAEHEVVFGWGEIETAPARLSNLGGRPLVLAGNGSARRSGTLGMIVDGLQDFGCTPVTLEGVGSEPEISIVDGAAQLARQNDCDFVVGVGGGSIMDTAKAVAATVRLETTSWNLTSWGRSDRRDDANVPVPLPIACIPTVAASGSEVNGTGVLTNSRLHEKAVFYHEHLVPRFSLIDPALTVTVDPDQTWTGAMDIVAHGIENYLTEVSPKVEQAMKCIRLSSRVLEMASRASQNPADQQARTALSRMAMEVWTDNYNGPNTPWSLHAIAHVVGAQLKLGHSSVIAHLLPAWIELIRTRDPDRLTMFDPPGWPEVREAYWPRETPRCNMDALAQKVMEIYGDKGTMPGWPGLTQKDVLHVLTRVWPISSLSLKP